VIETVSSFLDRLRELLRGLSAPSHGPCGGGERLEVFIDFVSPDPKTEGLRAHGRMIPTCAA
jgi:hypothetical protein